MEQYCAKCRSLIRSGAVRCDRCGELAGDVFDGKIRKPDRPRRGAFLHVLLVLLALTGAYWWWTHRQGGAARAPAPALPSTRVVADRPGGARRGEGAKLSEPEAIRALQRQLVEEGKTRDCLVVSSQGYADGGYRLSALDRCADTRLGSWRVDGVTGAISRGR